MIDIQATLTTAIEKLNKASDSAILDAEVLLSHVLKKPRSHLRAWPEKALTTQEQTQFLQLIAQRLKGVPIAYIIGYREFWSLDFKVNPDVLIPRPDTELLIDLSLKLLKDTPQAQIVDLGTGSGIIAISLATERPDLEVFATDLSEKALSIAKQNATKHQIKNIRFFLSDWFDAIDCSKFDLIISNPPYINENDPHLSQGDLRFEPKTALIAEDQGLKDIKIITKQARLFLKSGATLLIEHGFNQQVEVHSIFNTLKYINITTHSDLAGHPRVTSGRWNP